MIVSLCIEAFHDDLLTAIKKNSPVVRRAMQFRGRASLIRDVFRFEQFKNYPWLASVSFNGRGIEREFVKGKKDYTRADSTGSKGVCFYYLIKSGVIYEVAKFASPDTPERYFFTLCPCGDEKRMTEAEAIECLQNAA